MKNVAEAQPRCPTCLKPMYPAQRIAPRATSRLRAGTSVLPPRVLPVWRCDECRIDTPRLDVAA